MLRPISEMAIQQIKALLPKRKKSSNKTTVGTSLIIGGGSGFYGAGLLAALAATKSGSGYTHLLTDLTPLPWLKYPDFIMHPMKLNELKKLLAKVQFIDRFAIGIGPGMGINLKNKQMLASLIKQPNLKVVVDADALSILAKYKMYPLPTNWILTPHEGELARLLNCSSLEVKKDRKKALKQAVDQYQCTILLKGACTLIAGPQKKKIQEVKAGTPALSKAGTGDVLLGMITAFLAQGLSNSEAAYLGSFIHGSAARDWENSGNDQLSLRPTDLIEQLPKTIFKIRYSI
jgi:NAD(P)H-hydrate epimerase